MSNEVSEDDRNWKLAILQTAEKLGAKWFIEEKIEQETGYLLFCLGILATSELSKKPPPYRGRHSSNKIGRPRKSRIELKPVKLYLQVHSLQEFFEKTAGIQISHRDAIKLLIKNGEIQDNVELNHIEKQVSAGKKKLQEMRSELLNLEKSASNACKKDR